MKQYYHILKKTALFRGVSQTEIEAMLQCLAPTLQRFQKNEYVYRQGESVSAVGLVLSGSVHVVEEDFWGERNILANIEPSQCFGEVYACLPGELLRVNVVAASPCEILFLDAKRVLTICPSACRFHTQLVRNLLAEVARKNLMLTQKLSDLAKRSMRGKLLSYLSNQSLLQGRATFEIPFNRQQLADYLCVDRSAMSAALCRLRDEGVLSFEKNRFTLYESCPLPGEPQKWK